MRAEVLTRHLDDAAPARALVAGGDIYAVSRADLDRMAATGAVHMARELGKVLFDSAPTIGLELPRAHFHLRSLTLKPWCGHSAPWGGTTGRTRLRLQTLHPRPVYPPHLMKFTTNFLFEKDPTRTPPFADDPAGRSERMLIDLPVLYWTIVEDGQWRSQWTAFPSSDFTPPADSLAPSTVQPRAASARWPRTNVAPDLS
jgi:hypothetical protein